jgi:hypothetical protein
MQLRTDHVLRQRVERQVQNLEHTRHVVVMTAQLSLEVFAEAMSRQLFRVPLQRAVIHTRQLI